MTVVLKTAETFNTLFSFQYLCRCLHRVFGDCIKLFYVDKEEADL